MNSVKTKRILKTINLTILSVFLIFSITLVISCKNSPQTADITGSTDSNTSQTVTGPESSEAVKDNNSSNAEAASQDAIMKDFDELLISQARSYQVVSFIDQNIYKMSPRNADIVLEKLEYIQKNDKQFYTDLLLEDDWQSKLNDIFNNDIEIKDIQEITNEQLKKITEEIFRGGFKLIALEGSFYPFIDYEFLKKYSDYLSQQFRDYLNIMAVESNKIFSRDAALAISWDELAFRLINCEGFLISYPEDNVRKKEVGDLYMKYLVSYFLGQNNTPSFSYENNAISPDVLDSYDKLVSQYPDNITTDLTKKYQSILEGDTNIVNDSVYKELDEIYKEAVRAFGLDTQALLLESAKNTYYQTPLTENGYAILLNGKYNENDVTVRLSDFTSFEDFDGDGINDAAVILLAEKPDSTITYSLALNINKYFYFKNIPDVIIGNSSELEILSLEIKENKIFLTSLLNQTEKSTVFGVKDDQLFEYQ